MQNNKIFDFITNEIENNKVVLFMKGTKHSPECGFSGLVVQILNNLNVEFKDIDVLQNQDLRQGIKDYSEWLTIPQLYIDKQFIGGADIAREMYESGELRKILEKSI
ncbi:MAG: Grx4 family monothiol glutaredoxin [Proteobacteria bacterium]|nr:Grx4 family monothiol glutaredoxin [Pseudomonadota bacterium]